METKDITITMLGTTQAGKTCYMLALYAVMSMGVKGFTLSTDGNKDIELSDAWERMIDTTGKDRFPPPTAEEPIPYKFDFKYGLTTKLMGFDWLDYRGGALRDATPNQKDVEELTSRLSKSSCIFLCVSGEHLEQPINASVLKKARIDRMNLFLGKLGDAGEKVPIVIVVTKADCCSNRPKLDVVADIKQLFDTLFNKGIGGGWPVMICPVTLGKELAQNPDKGRIDPRNVHLPLVFAIYFEYLKIAWEAKGKVESARSILDKAQDRNWFSKLLDKLDGNDRVGYAMNDLQTKEQQMASIQEKINLLTRELRSSEIYIYINGEEQEINV